MITVGKVPDFNKGVFRGGTMNENIMQQLLAENTTLKQDNEKLWKIIHVQQETIDKLWKLSKNAACP